VATGHLIGRLVGGLFGTSAAAPPQEEASAAGAKTASQFAEDATCSQYRKLFERCLQQNPESIATCQDYMAMLKTCQSSSL